MANPRDVELNIVGRDQTDKPTRSAGDNLDKLAHKADEVDEANKQLGSRAGRHLRKVSDAVRGVASKVDSLKRKTEDGTLAIRSMGSKTAGSLRRLSRALDDAGDEADELNRQNLRHLRREIDETEKKTSRLKGAFKKIETSAQASFKSVSRAMSATASKLRALWEVAIVPVIIAAIGELPLAATIAGEGIVLGLGGALAFLGIKSAAQFKVVQDAFSDLKFHVLKDLKVFSVPFAYVLLNIAKRLTKAFDSLAPVLDKAFFALAGIVDSFSEDVIGSLDKLKPAIIPIVKSFKVLAEGIGKGMPVLLGDIATAFTDIADALEDNPQAITDTIVGLGNLIKTGGKVIAWLIRQQATIDASEAGFDTMMLHATKAMAGVALAAARMAAGVLDALARIPGPGQAAFRLLAAAAHAVADSTQHSLDKINTKVAAADIRKFEAQLRVLGNQKPTPEVLAEISDLRLKIAQAKGILSTIDGKEATVYVNTKFRRQRKGDRGPALGAGSPVYAGGVAFAHTAPGGNWRTGGPVEVAAPSVTTYVQLDGREIAAHVRTVISEATGRQAFRARSGRR